MLDMAIIGLNFTLVGHQSQRPPRSRVLRNFGIHLGFEVCKTSTPSFVDGDRHYGPDKRVLEGSVREKDVASQREGERPDNIFEAIYVRWRIREMRARAF